MARKLVDNVQRVLSAPFTPLAFAYSKLGELNPATLSGAIDIVVVEHDDGTMHSTPFHVRFGKFHILKSRKQKDNVDDEDEQRVTSPILSPSPRTSIDEPSSPDRILQGFSLAPDGNNIDLEVRTLVADMCDVVAAAMEAEVLGRRSVFSRHRACLITHRDHDPKDGDSKLQHHWRWKWGSFPVERSSVASPTHVFSDDDSDALVENTPDSSARRSVFASFFGKLFRSSDVNEQAEAMRVAVEQIDIESQDQTAVETLNITQTTDAAAEGDLEDNDVDHVAHGDDSAMQENLGFDLEIPSAMKRGESSVNLEGDEGAERNRRRARRRNRHRRSLSIEHPDQARLETDHGARTALEVAAQPLESVEQVAAYLASTEFATSASLSLRGAGPPPFSLSLCGHLLEGGDRDAALFARMQVDFATVSEDPSLWDDPTLIASCRCVFVPAKMVAVALSSWCAFQKPPSSAALLEIAHATGLHRMRDFDDASDLAATPSDTRSESSSWRKWLFSPKTPEPPATDTRNAASPDVGSSGDSAAIAASAGALAASAGSGASNGKAPMPAGDADAEAHLSDSSSSSLSASEVLSVDSDSAMHAAQAAGSFVGEDYDLKSDDDLPSTSKKGRRFFVKSLTPTTDMLRALNLRAGANKIEFSVITGSGEPFTLESRVYLWNSTTKIVVSDIDGTITRSDVLGHIFTFVGKDWSHAGVTSLFANIAKNGYSMMYLTSRAIGLSSSTRAFIRNLEKDGSRLPDGPVMMSPDRLFQSLTREVIHRRPDVFKIACLRNILSLYPDDRKPFYAGFGNRPTDAKSYRSVGIPEGRIFIINPKGKLSTIADVGSLDSYSSLNVMVDEVFPYLKASSDMAEESDFNEWNYWRSPVEEVAID